VVGSGEVWHGQARQVRCGLAGHDWARSGRQGKAGFGMARSGTAWRGALTKIIVSEI